MNREKLSDAIFKIAGAFLLLHADLNFGRVNCLPDWLGYGWIISTLDTLSEEEPSAELLRPIGYILAGWSFAVWLFDFFGQSLNGYGIGVIMSVLRLYFQFQLLTNLASIAKKYAPQHTDPILKLRSVMTVVLTGYTLYTVFGPPQAVTLVIALVYFSAAVLTCKVLMAMQRDIVPLKGEETSFSERIKQNAEAYDQMK